jgi:molybdopterin/thiamine biosynthesis adenylyltransferase
MTPRFDYHEAFSRNVGLVSVTEQEQVRQSRIAIAGMGGVGGVHLLTLARLGFEKFSLSDFDRFELANMNRQAGATIATLGKPKLETMAEMVMAINPDCDLRLFRDGICPANIDAFLEGAVAAVDGIDFFNMAARRLLFSTARALGIHAVTAAPVGAGSAILVFAPTGMSFDDYFDIRDEMTLGQQLFQFGLGLTPRMLQRSYFTPSSLDLSGKRAPSLGSACSLAAALVGTEMLNLVVRRRPVRAAPYYYQFDPLVRRYAAGRLWWGNRHPLQRAKRWWVLRTNPRLREAMKVASTS